MAELRRKDDVPLDVYRTELDAKWGEFARTYREWSDGQRDDDTSYAIKQVRWERYVLARDAWIATPKPRFQPYY